MLSRLFFGGLIGIALSLQPAVAQDRVDQLYDIGWEACIYALKGHFDSFDAEAAAADLEAAGRPTAEYCHCVATEFTTGDDEDLMLLNADSLDSVDHLDFMLNVNAEFCLPTSRWIVDGDVEDGDLSDEYASEALPDEDFAYDEEDVRMCQLTLDDVFMTPGYRAADVIEQLEQTGQSRTQLCTCAARYFAAGGEGLKESIEGADNPSLSYAYAMGEAIEVCL